MRAEGQQRRKFRREFGVGFIGTVNGVAVDKSDFRRFLLAKIGLFARAGNVMRAMHDRLHPAQPRVARRADLLLGESGRRQRTKESPPSCSFRRAVRLKRARTISPS